MSKRLKAVERVQTLEGSRTLWKTRRGDKYIATGTDRRGKRFRIVSKSWPYISAINIYRGSKWVERADGKRIRVAATYN